MLTITGRDRMVTLFESATWTTVVWNDPYTHGGCFYNEPLSLIIKERELLIMHKRISTRFISREEPSPSSNVVNKLQYGSKATLSFKAAHLRNLRKMQKDPKCSVPCRGGTQTIGCWAQGCSISGDVQCKWTKGTVALTCLHTTVL